MGHGRGTRRRADDGAAAVEFAIIAPLLLFLLFAIIGYGYMLSFRQGLSQAAAEGAREAAVAPSDRDDSLREADARDSVNASLASYGVTCSSNKLFRDSTEVGTCLVDIGTCADGGTDRCVTVKLGFEYAKYPLVPVPGLGIVLPEHLTYTAAAEVS